MEQHEVWDGLVGDAWVTYADELELHSAPFGLAAMDTLGPLDGATVLDVGCGTGITTLELASRVGPSGLVTGVDLSEPMIARARARAAGRTGVSFIVGDVLDLALASPVDVVFSRFGVMFFDDPVVAFARLRAFTRDSGRLAFAAWSDPFSNPWMLTPVMASIPVLGAPELPAPGAPGPFSLSGPDVIATTLAAAGWSAVEVTDLSIESPMAAGGAAEMAAMVCTTNPVLAAGLERASEHRADVEALVTQALVEHERDGVVVLQAAALIVSARA